MSRSTELAAQKSLFAVWDPETVFPEVKNIPDPDIISHIAVSRAKEGEWHYLHEAAIQWHKDRFYVAFANARTHETGDYDEIIRGCTSVDGFRWSEPQIWAQPPLIGANSYNHPLLFSHQGILYGFFVCWDEQHNPSTEIFTLDECKNEWVHHPEASIPLFLPFCTPQLMEDGNWIIGGENHWDDSAVAISDGENLLHWKMVKIPREESCQIRYPESSVIDLGNGHLIDFCRPNNVINEKNPLFKMDTAPVSESFDYGKTWSVLTYSNFPLSDSQPFSGRLSTGQNYLITNSLEDGRALLTIALTEPGGKLFKKIYKIRHQQWPARRLFGGFGGKTYPGMERYSAVGSTTEWSYPNATEHDGNLYIVCSQGKEDCVLSVIPVDQLK